MKYAFRSTFRGAIVEKELSVPDANPTTSCDHRHRVTPVDVHRRLHRSQYNGTMSTFLYTRRPLEQSTLKQWCVQGGIQIPYNTYYKAECISNSLKVSNQKALQAPNLRGIHASLNPRFYGRNPTFYGKFQYILM